MRILIFSLAYDPVVGGAEVAVKELTNRLGEIEFDMVTKRFDSSHKAVEKIGNVNVYRINTSKTLFPINAFLEARVLHRRKPYDAIWSIMAAYAGFAALFFKLSKPKVRFILNLQEGDPLDYIQARVGFLSPLFKRIFTKADKVQAISNFLADWARKMGHKGQVEVIPNGVDVNKFLNPALKMSSVNTVLITTSRLVKKNGVGEIIESLNLLSPNVKLQIIGIGELESVLKQRVKDLHLESRVEFMGFISQSEIPKHLHQADIFIRPSLSEGMGISFIEAMAAGLPVIATPVGGIPDFLKDGETGVFCEPENPESIAKAVTRLISDPFLVQKIKENALKMVKERYDWDLIAKEMKTRVFDKV
jgi:glycosyltransferase involved in cell wall biosynthesis